jgi:hypothetical protein
MTELDLSDTPIKGTVLFSYKTPVAFVYSGDDTVYVTNKFWSCTTSRHINQWVVIRDLWKTSNRTVIAKPQEWFDNLIARGNNENY